VQGGQRLRVVAGESVPLPVVLLDQQSHVIRARSAMSTPDVPASS
jgi:hypothetical protein